MPGLEPLVRSPRTAISAAVARRLFRAAVGRLAVTVVEEPTGRRLGQGGPDDAPAPPRRVLRPPGPRRPDRLRRVLPHRRVGHRRPRRLPHRAGRADGHLGPRLAAAAARLRDTPPAEPPPQHRGQQPGQHLAPLRPVQRPLRALPRRDAELFLRALRHLLHAGREGPRLGRRPPGRHATGAHRRRRPAPAPRRPRAGPGPQDRAAARRGGRRRGQPGPRDRHRLGRARDPRRPPRRDRALASRSRSSSSSWPRSASPPPASPTG